MATLTTATNLAQRGARSEGYEFQPHENAGISRRTKRNKRCVSEVGRGWGYFEAEYALFYTKKNLSRQVGVSEKSLSKLPNIFEDD